jgi:hypothetical protein
MSQTTGISGKSQQSKTESKPNDICIGHSRRQVGSVIGSTMNMSHNNNMDTNRTHVTKFSHHNNRSALNTQSVMNTERINNFGATVPIPIKFPVAVENIKVIQT